MALTEGSTYTYNQLFFQLNCFNYFRLVIDSIYANRVFDANYGLDSFFLVLKQIIHLLNEQLIDKSTKE